MFIADISSPNGWQERFRWLPQFVLHVPLRAFVHLKVQYQQYTARANEAWIGEIPDTDIKSGNAIFCPSGECENL